MFQSIYNHYNVLIKLCVCISGSRGLQPCAYGYLRGAYFPAAVPSGLISSRTGNYTELEWNVTLVGGDPDNSVRRRFCGKLTRAEGGCFKRGRYQKKFVPQT